MPSMACSLRPIHCAALQTAGAAPRSSQAVGVPSLLAAPRRARRSCAVAAVRVAASGKKSTQSEEVSAAAQPASSVVMSLAVAAPLLLAAQDAAAAGGAYGILEGRTGALVHPAMMGFLLGAQAYAAYLGWQWRRARTIPEEVAALKQSLPKASDDAAAPAPVLSAEQLATAAKVEELQAERKSILASGVRETHFNWGSLLLALGVAIGVEGPVNTYLRTGKLFPGPHLYAGAAIVVLWAAAAACVPQMQKGNDTARTAHIGLNGVNMLLFLWQVPTGLEIVAKVFQFTKWP